MDYSKAKIYKILNTVDDDIYIGATCQPLSKRMAKHRDCRNGKCKKHYKLYQKMNNLGYDNFYIELIKETPCDNAEQLRAIEGEYIRQRGTLNTRIEGRTKQQYTIDNKEKKAEYDKEYREANKEYRKQQKAEYHEQNKEYYNQRSRENYQKIREQKETCEVCGISYIPWHRKKHLATKRHQQAMEQL